jgi:hypothetical protein
MPTNSRTWKKAEGRVASLFGARRQVLSGSSGRDDLSSSDSTHPRLFIEAKYRVRHATRSLFDETKALARKEGKTPLVALVDKARHGYLICIHCEDLPRVVAEFTLANPDVVAEAIAQAQPPGAAITTLNAEEAA